jgi:hypothetical protein
MDMRREIRGVGGGATQSTIGIGQRTGMGANGDEEEEKQTMRGKRKGETVRKDCLLIAMVGSWKGGGRGGAKRGEAIRIVVT